jgi:peptidyl-prolyl cis-trans isomerase A (cyclophilin A)
VKGLPANSVEGILCRMRRPWAILILAGGCASSGGGDVAVSPVPARGPDALNPKDPEMSRTAPEVFRVLFDTTRGAFTVEATRAWAPKGADRFYNLVRAGFYDGARFFRVVPGFVAQFGLPADPRLAAAWKASTIPDDPVKTSNVRGTLTFATAGPNTRTTQLFLNFGHNARLDAMGFAPFAKVVDGQAIVDAINPEYGERPNQGRIQAEGEAYLVQGFPRLDVIRSARLVNE